VGFVSLLGLEWKPLLVAIPVFVFSVFLIVVQAVVSARNAVFIKKPKTRFKKLKYYGLTTFLYIIQPIARLKGRIDFGLFPLRDGLRNLRYYKHLSVLPNRIEFWSEEWRPMEDWLENISQALVSYKNKVKKGGEYDRWDFQYQTGPFIYARALLTIEEHGKGRQNLKIKKWISFSTSALVFLTLLLFMTYQAYFYEAFISASIFGLISSFLMLKLLADVFYTKASLNFAIKSLAVNPGKVSTNDSLSTSDEIIEKNISISPIPELIRIRADFPQD
jgi:hypothetical protein